jgi:Fe-S cluster assembly protein SufD
MTALPSRRDEAWRYSDHEAVARLWPPAPPRLLDLPAGATHEEAIAVTDEGLTDLRVTLAAGARLSLVILISQPGFARVAIDATLCTGAHLDLGGVLLADGSATGELVTMITHAEPGATSRQRVRLVADGRGVVTCLGRIAVARDAQHTDADQSLRALVLQRTATANLKPELEIFADDVSCAHGCTVGELDGQALFYLQSRGVPLAQARTMLTRAFLADALAPLTSDAARARLEELIGTFMEARA